MARIWDEADPNLEMGRTKKTTRHDTKHENEKKKNIHDTTNIQHISIN